MRGSTRELPGHGRYHSHPDAYPYEIVNFAMEDFEKKAKEANPKIEIRPWLQDFDYLSNYGPADVEAQIKATYDSNLEGWLLWNAATKYTTGVLQKEKQ